MVVPYTEKVLQQIKNGLGESTTDKTLDDTAINAIDRLYGGECETVDEVYEDMQWEGIQHSNQKVDPGSNCNH